MAAPVDHDAYIDAAPELLRPLLVQLRTQLAKTLPDAEEIIAYNMPGFGFGKSIIAGYAAFSKQCGLYVSHGAIAAHADEIAANGLKATKMGVTFSPAKPITDELIAKIALTCRKELGL
ncbi:MAG: DUF1801 domain-containing protein [Paracoccaceae bacterium]